jgi:acetolactate synthase small subunit
VVEVHDKQLKDGVDREVMMMKIMNRMKIHQHLQMVHLLGHHVVDKQDEVVA